MANLNADRLDGIDGSQFARNLPPAWTSVTGTTNPVALAPGKFVCYDPGSLGNYDECWQNFDATHNSASFTKDALGYVHLRGLVKCVPASSTSFGSRDCEKADTTNVIFVLPNGYRPLRNSLFATVSLNTFGRVNVNTDGKVVVEVGDVYYSDGGYVSLDGITFATN